MLFSGESYHKFIQRDTKFRWKRMCFQGTARYHHRSGSDKRLAPEQWMNSPPKRFDWKWNLVYFCHNKHSETRFLSFFLSPAIHCLFFQKQVVIYTNWFLFRSDLIIHSIIFRSKCQWEAVFGWSRRRSLVVVVVRDSLISSCNKLRKWSYWIGDDVNLPRTLRLNPLPGRLNVKVSLECGIVAL